MANKTKVLFIGIDAADKHLIRQWADAGLLPTFQSLFEKSAWGTTTNPVGLYVGAIWPSFATSVSPARHGCYCYTQIHSGNYQTTKFSVFDLKGEMFWETLSHAGRKVAVIDIPRTPPSENLNGIQIVDWGTHDPDLPDKLYTWPTNLATEVEAQFGRDPIGYCNAIKRTPEGLINFREQLVMRATKKGELSRQLLNQGDWDLFMTVFAESHCVGHQCWNIHDPNHPKHRPDIASAVGNPIKDVYIAIDQEIGKLLQQVDSETTVFVLASHGMGPHYDGTFLLDDVLCRLENVKTPAMRRQIAKALNTSWEKNPLLGWLLSPLKNRVWKPLRNRVWKSDKPVRQAMAEPNVSYRKCFTVPNNDVYGAIRVNLAGREPQGRIQPGAEYDAFCTELTQDLLDIINVDTGKPLVRRVLRTADFYQGESLDDLPDLMVEWNREQPIATISSPKIGTITKSFPGVRTGDHQPDGLFFAYGPSVKPGQIEGETSVMDFAPTIASLLNVELHYAEGKPIAKVIK